MALRVLLADESNTIKKVFQLALQDYAVNVKSVNLGVDVVEAAKNFKPDIIFADVLLQKKNGYDVAHDLKADSQLRNTPVVLMWSGFLELDQDKFQASRADGKLEKPFDVDSLRSLIRNHVPKTQSQVISKYLTFPKMPDIQDDEAKIRKRAQDLGLGAPSKSPVKPDPVDDFSLDASVTNEPPAKENMGNWNMESFDPIDEFKEKSFADGIQKKNSDDDGGELILDEMEPADQEWVKKDLSHFQVDSKILRETTPSAKFELPEEDLGPDLETTLSGVKKIEKAPPPLESQNFGEDLSIDDLPPTPQSTFTHKSNPKIESAVSQDKVEALVREAVQDAVWKIVPELAKQLIEKEIDRLLKEEASP